MSRYQALCPALLLLVVTVLLAGCTPHPSQSNGNIDTAPSNDPYRMTVEEVERMPLDPNIVEVHTHYNLFPWLQYDPSDPRPQGFMVSSLFLVSGKTGKGVFGKGTISVKMFRVDRDEQRRETRRLVHTWQFNPAQALPYRAVRRTIIGEGYQLRLRWPNDIDLIEREIVVIVEFTRPDGKTIRSGAKSLKVPIKVNG